MTAAVRVQVVSMRHADGARRFTLTSKGSYADEHDTELQCKSFPEAVAIRAERRCSSNHRRFGGATTPPHPPSRAQAAKPPPPEVRNSALRDLNLFSATRRRYYLQGSSVSRSFGISVVICVNRVVMERCLAVHTSTQRRASVQTMLGVCRRLRSRAVARRVRCSGT